jgi:isochorismate synthase
MQDNLKKIIRILWSKQLPFVAYSFPREEEVTILVQQNPTIQTFKMDKIESVKGFIIAPFESALTKEAYLLEPEFIFNRYSDPGEAKKLPSANNTRPQKLNNRIWQKGTYLKKANKIIAELKENKLQKLVLTRIIEKKLTRDIDPGQMYYLINEKFEHSFNYLLHLPFLGSWVGASPETFFKVKNGVAETVSLAGTKHVSEIKWTLKEKHEQAIVTDFISHQLKRLGIMHYTRKGPETVKAGQVAHLSTIFSIPLKDLKDKIARLISHLHPTPAVCGLPQKEALDYILNTEEHDRKFYTGFLGPWGINQRSELFVNLRCAEVSNDMLHLFVGGGLTSASEAKSEWNETIHKSETLLSVIENL